MLNRREVLSICASIGIFLVFWGLPPTLLGQALEGSQGIKIIDIRPGMGKDIPDQSFETGPDVGHIINAHYIPGNMYYGRGNYTHAVAEMDYFIARPQFTAMHPRQSELFSIAHYIRAMCYFYHAEGLGRLALSKKDFEESVRWNPKNYFSSLELARVNAALGSRQDAISILRRLLDSKPDENVAQEAKEQLNSLLAAAGK